MNVNFDVNVKTVAKTTIVLLFIMAVMFLFFRTEKMTKATKIINGNQQYMVKQLVEKGYLVLPKQEQEQQPQQEQK